MAMSLTDPLQHRGLSLWETGFPKLPCMDSKLLSVGGLGWRGGRRNGSQREVSPECRTRCLRLADDCFWLPLVFSERGVQYSFVIILLNVARVRFLWSGALFYESVSAQL